MKTTILLKYIVLFLGIHFIESFLPVKTINVQHFTTTTTDVINKLHAKLNNNNNNDELALTDESFSRRNFMKSITGVTSTLLLSQQSFILSSAFAIDESAISQRKEKILVLGGTGFVGTQIVQQLQNLNIPVISTSRDGRDNTIALDVTKENAINNIIPELTKDITCIISCIGSIGTDNDEIINSATGTIAILAKKSNVQRFVYITVAPDVKEFASNIDFLKGYMNGKTYSRSTILNTYGDNTNNSIFIEPTFIYGGNTFNINPPRVASFYGNFIENLLSSGPIRSIESVMPSGIIKIALEPPVNVNDIAKAAIAGALGKSPITILDSYDKIKQAATLI